MNSMYNYRLDHSLINIVNSSVIDLPSPQDVSFFWNYGFYLGFFLVIQLFTGIFLSFNYNSEISFIFFNIDSFSREVSWYTFFRFIHSNGASLYFFCLYIHMFRGIYYSSYNYYSVWLVGCIIFVLSMAVAFLGYVLPWGNMSLWGATVITKLFSSIPYIGNDIVLTIWGGYSITSFTVGRFFSLHYLLPFVIVFMVVIHIFLLHETGSNNPLGLYSSSNKIFFSPYFLIKDLFGYLFIFFLFIFLVLLIPFQLMDVDNFNLANFLSTPEHIQPEWYFLPAYAILRSLPSKGGGVIFLVLFVFIFFIIPFISFRYHSLYGKNINDFEFSIFFFFWVVNFILLMWIGGSSVVYPYIWLSRVFSFFYFLFFFLF
uniref:Cytochrome b n=1 Tax=Amaga expatria TaxID=2744267 RepID=A0A899L4K1_9PLAT|nr:cytochrome b [Amaga expatria]QSM34666.1 cytochrome b [Amaga expatria]